MLQGLKVYKDPKLFWTEVSPHLRHDEAKNNLLLGLARSFVQNSENCLYESALFDQGALLGAFICSKYKTDHVLVVSPTPHPQQARELFDAFIKTGTPVMGLVGETKTADFYKDFFQQQGKTITLRMAQGIYRCQQVKLAPEPPGTVFRVATTKDLAIVGKWAEEFHAEATPQDPPMDGAAFAQDRIQAQAIYLVEVEGDPKGMAAKTRDIETACTINMVYTPKKNRKKGYASIVTGRLTDLLLKSGKRETNLFTDISNPTSNKIYQNLGYQYIGDSVQYGVK
ncbi:hypothetical protein K2X30_15665 [bacterium]|nr:hypothetical protein [bacterium]